MTTLSEPARILVVCTANIARSPLAEVLLRAHVQQRSLTEQVAVASAGVHARPGQAAADSSREIATTWGLDLAAHLSQPATSELVGHADLVVTMSARQRDHLGGSVRGVHARTFTLKELARLLDEVDTDLGEPGADRVRAATTAAHRRRPLSRPSEGGEDIADPFGGPHDGYVTMANELVGLHERIAPVLLGAAEP